MEGFVLEYVQLWDYEDSFNFIRKGGWYDHIFRIVSAILCYCTE